MKTNKPFGSKYQSLAFSIHKEVQNSNFTIQGFFSLWKGFTPYYFRLGPHTVLTFIFLEQMNIAYKLHVLGIKGGSGGL